MGEFLVLGTCAGLRRSVVIGTHHSDHADFCTAAGMFLYLGSGVPYLNIFFSTCSLKEPI